MKRKIIILSSIALIICAISYTIYAWSGLFSFGGIGISDMELNSTEDRLYVSYYSDNAVVEVNTETMQEVRRFGIIEPGVIRLDEQASFMYVTSLWPGRINRVNLTNGQISSLNLAGEAVSLFLDTDNERLWVVHRTWPVRGDVFEPSHLGSHPNTGYFTEIDTTDFSIIGTYDTSMLPSCIWHSDDMERLYVYHEYDYREPVEDFQAYNEDALAFRGGLISSYNITSGDPIYTSGLKGGLQDFIDDLPMSMTAWTGNGRYFAVPARSVTKPEYSIRVFDSADGSVYLDYAIPGDNGHPVWVFDLEREEGTDYIWAIIKQYPFPQGGNPDTRYIARIDTVTQDYNLYPVADATDWIGCLEIASQARKAYMSMPWKGQVIVMDLD